VVRLSGNVVNEAQRRDAIAQTKTAPGVLRIDNQLVSDEQLVDTVALAMVPYPKLQSSRERVSAKLGRVMLEGELGSEDDVELANRVAAEVPSVAVVETGCERSKDSRRPSLPQQPRRTTILRKPPRGSAEMPRSPLAWGSER
jgi:osmotically-inducible protein OsmY